MYKKPANTYISLEFSIAAQNSKQVGVTIRFVARFGRSKVRALGLVSSGVKEREANRSDVEKERLDTKRDRSGAVRGSKRTQPLLLSCWCGRGFRQFEYVRIPALMNYHFTQNLDRTIIRVEK